MAIDPDVQVLLDELNTRIDGLVPIGATADLNAVLAGGGLIRLDGGVFPVSGQINVPSNTRLVGSGPDTVLKVDVGATLDAVLAVHGRSDVSITDLAIDVSGAVAGLRRGIGGAGSPTNISVRRVKISGTAGASIILEGPTRYNANIVIDDCDLDSESRGIWLLRTSDVQIRNTRIYNTNWESIKVDELSRVAISDCVIRQDGGDRWTYGAGAGINTDTDVRQISVTNCQFYDIRNDAVDFHYVTDGLISGCLVVVTADSGLMVPLNSSHVTVTGNTVTDVPFHAYGATSSGGVVSDVVFSGNVAVRAGKAGFCSETNPGNPVEKVRRVLYTGNLAVDCAIGYSVNSGDVRDVTVFGNAASGCAIPWMDESVGQANEFSHNWNWMV